MPTSPHASPHPTTPTVSQWDLVTDGMEAWAEHLVGTILDERYSLEQVLGCGATGAVFRARHEPTGRPVAVKVLHEALRADPRSWTRFEREVRGAARLRHPNCVEILDLGTGHGRGYFAMPFVEGRELAMAIVEGMSLPMALTLFDQILAGLEHAHAQGIIHRDIKPENILLVQQPGVGIEVKLIDFGIAKLDAPADETGPTLAGEVFGTPQYMSPEQTRGETVTNRTDLYSAGLVLFEMLTGLPAFTGDDAFELMRQQLSDPAPPLPSHLPAPLGRLMDRLLAKDPAERFVDATEARQALASVAASLHASTASVSAGARPTAQQMVPGRRRRARRRSRPTRSYASRGTQVYGVGRGC